ncbi:hypothetical protein ACRZ5S_19840 [Vibrio scophthalmi]|uniref:hypothetical protein n=1 Tax=Vibrio scophthalmi TaxID=45658 RepID=UPI003EBD60B4
MKKYKVNKLKKFLENEIEIADRIANYVSRVSLESDGYDDAILFEFIRCSIVDFFLLESDIEAEDYNRFVKYLGFLSTTIQTHSEKKEMSEIIEQMLIVSYGLSKKKTKRQSELFIKDIKTKHNIT